MLAKTELTISLSELFHAILALKLSEGHDYKYKLKHMIGIPLE